MKQSPSSVFMIRPEHFGFNPETAKSNAFQPDKLEGSLNQLRSEAILQFDDFAALLKKQGINVFTFHSPKYKKLPDAVFPNNWVTFHEDGKVIIYPMLAKNRRLERRLDVIDQIGEHFQIKEIVDLSVEENYGNILEGSGSIVFDHTNMTAYANESPRTNRELFDRVCSMMGYEGVFFKAIDENGIDIFHTNVMMNIGVGYAVICAESIAKDDQKRVLGSLQKGGLEIVEITLKQMKKFVGNMIQLCNGHMENFLILSDSAFFALTQKQKAQLTKYVDFVHSDLSVIEKIGGGSARCMIAGIHMIPK